MGGLGFNTNKIGTVNGILGVMSVVSRFAGASVRVDFSKVALIVLYNPYAATLGVIWSYRIGLLAFIPGCLTFPLLNSIATGPAFLRWMWICIVSLVRSDVCLGCWHVSWFCAGLRVGSLRSAVVSWLLNLCLCLLNL